MEPAIVESYFQSGHPATFLLLDEPVATMTIDPIREEIRLETPARGTSPDVTAMERLTVATVPRKDGNWFELRVDAADARYEAYAFVVSVVDHLRVGASVIHAVSEAISAMKDLMRSRRSLTDEKVAGLIGELLVFNQVLAELGEDAAIAAWLGPLAEEHDFGLPGFDAEVKTTRSESRVHVIGSEHQLERSPDRALYLISVQITRAGAAEEGFSLPDLVASTRARLSSHRAFDPALERVGWRDIDADLYSTRYQLRSQPRAYLVDDEFPALTSRLLDAVVPQRELVSSITYRVDVSKLSFASAPAPLTHLCEEA